MCKILWYLFLWGTKNKVKWRYAFQNVKDFPRDTIQNFSPMSKFKILNSKFLLTFVLCLVVLFLAHPPEALAAIPTFQAKGAFTSGTGALIVPVPAGYQDNDVFLLFVGSANQAIVVIPTGWTEIANSPQFTGPPSAAGGVRLTVFYKVVSGAQSSVSVDDILNYTTAIIANFRGVKTSAPINLTAGSVDALATSALSAPSLVTTVNDALIVNAIGLDKDLADTDTLSGAANTNLSTLTEQHDQTVAANAGGGLAFYTGGKAIAGSTGNTTATGDTSTTHAYITIALEPNPSSTLTVSTVGTQTITLLSGATSQHIGGAGTAAFRLQIDTGSATVSSVKISEIDSAGFASYPNTRLFYDLDTTAPYDCADQSFALTDLLFGGVVLWTGDQAKFDNIGVSVSATQTLCAYLVFDIPASEAGKIIDVQITNPSTDVVVIGAVNSDGAVKNISGITAIRAPSGTVMSSPIDFDWIAGQGWAQAQWFGTESGGDIKIQVYRKNIADCDTVIPNAVLPNNESPGIDLNIIDLSPLNIDTAITYNRLCLKATLAAVSASPVLDNLNITWQPPGGGGNLSQSGYRWFTDQNGLDVGAFLQSQNILHTLTTNGQDVRLRVLMHSNNGLAQSGQTFKLQYVGKGTGSCASPSGGTPVGWTDVSNNTLIALYNNPLPVDDNPLTPNVNDPQHLTHTTNNQTYNDSDSDPPATVDTFIDSVAPGIAAGNDGMWDFALFDNTAPSARTYCLRMVTSAGVVLDGGYSVYPELTTAVQYPLTGTYTSGDINPAASIRAWNIVEWNWQINPATSCPSCTMRFQIRTAATQAGLGAASWLGPDGTGATYYQGPVGDNRARISTTHNNQPWLNYRATFDGDGAHTPVLNRVKINYQ